MRFTVPLKLPTGLTVIVEAPAEPEFTLMVVGLAETPKLATLTVSGTV